MTTVHLEDYLSEVEPWHAAFMGAGQGGTVLLDSGTFLCPMEQIPHGLTIEGAGDSSVVMRRAGWYGPTLDANMRDDVTIRGLRVHGNHGAFAGYTGFMNGEVCINGRNNTISGVTIDNFVRFGIEACGVEPTVSNSAISGVGDGVHSAYGLLVPASAQTSGIRVLNNRVRGTYSAGIIAGGQGGTVSGNALDNCHIGELPAGVGGGQLALAMTMVNGTPTQSNGFVLLGNRIGPSTGRLASGIELDSCYDITLGGNVVMGQYGFGVSLYKCGSIVWSGGVISACDSVGVRVGAGCFAVTVTGAILRANRIGVRFEAASGVVGGSNLLALVGNQFLYQQEANLVNDSGAPNVTLLGNQWASLDPVQ